MMIAILPVGVRWHLGMTDQPLTEHLTKAGQRVNVTQPYSLRWVWSVCYLPVAEHPILRPVARERCQRCLEWLQSQSTLLENSGGR